MVNDKGRLFAALNMKGKVIDMKCYKLLRKAKDGKLYPLFINRKEETVFNKWLQAECYPTKGFAIRKGWHCCFKPYAPHLKRELANGEKRVWVECEALGCEKYNRPESQGGAWLLAQQLKIIRELTDKEVKEIQTAI